MKIGKELILINIYDFEVAHEHPLTRNCEYVKAALPLSLPSRLLLDLKSLH